MSTADSFITYTRTKVGLRKLDARWMFVGVWSWVFLLHALFYLVLTPPWQAPDEPTSVELLLTMQAKGRIVTPADKDPAIEQEIIASMNRSRYWELGSYGYRPEGQVGTFKFIYPCCNTQLSRPALYQLLMLPAAYWTDGWPIEQRLLVFRGLTIVLGILTVAVVTIISYELVIVHPALPLVVPALVALQPQFAYSSASFNSDNLVALVGALLFLILLRILRHGLSLKRVLSCVVLVVLGFLAKRTMLFMLPAISLGVLIQAAIMWRHGSSSVRRWLLIAGIGIFLAGAAAGLVPPLRADILSGLKRVVFQAGLAHYKSFVFDRLRWLPPWLPVSVPFLSRSFWGSFGWHQIFVAPPIQTILLWLTSAGWLAALGFLMARGKQLPHWSSRFLWLCVLSLVSALIITLINAPQGILPQGRYLFVVLAPIMLLLGLGFLWWTPRRWISLVVSLVWLGLLALDSYTILAVVIPGFYR